MVDETHLEELAAATRGLVRTVDGMEDRAYAEPSLLPGWSRGNVIAHLALNAEGLAAALRGLTEGRSVPMYASLEARAADLGWWLTGRGDGAGLTSDIGALPRIETW